MLKEFVWKTFEYTGNIDAFIFYREIEEKNTALADKITAEEVAISN